MKRSAARYLLFCLFFLTSCIPETITTVTEPLSAPGGEAVQILFDDFSYTAQEEMTANGWIIRAGSGWPGVPGATFRPENVTFVDYPDQAGNRLLRMAIGLGSGGTKFETKVDVRGAKGSLLHFSTTGGSNAMPGGATNPIPFSSVPTALLNAKDGVTADAARTARMIAGTLGNYLADHGWIAREKVPQVKMASQ